MTSESRTLYVLLGDWVGIASVLAILVLATALVIRSRRSPSSG
jgi:hypothetical protein